MMPTIRRLLGISLLCGAILTGCGTSSNSTTQIPTGSAQAPSASAASTSGPASDAAALVEAELRDPDLAFHFAPSVGLDPLVQSKRVAAGSPLTVSVAALQANYETLFCQLSTALGVTLSTPQSVAKIDFIKSQPQTGHFDLLSRPIQNNPMGVTGVSFQPVFYQTTVPLPAGAQTFQVSGGLLMPLGIDKTRLRGVIVYFHGTTFDKQQVGSNYLTNEETQLAAQVWASQGYVVLIPDYVGQGVDWQNVHPYVLYPTVSAKTAADMLNAVKSTVTAQYSLTNSDPPLPLFSTGYSEGGSYAIWFNTFVRSTPGVVDPMYALVHSVGMEGAYRTSSVIKPFLFGDVSTAGGNPYNIQRLALVNAVKPILSADAFLSYATYSQGANYGAVFSPSFFALDCGFLISQSDCDVSGSHLNMLQAFAQENVMVAKPLLYAAFGKSANGSTYPGRLEMPISSHNSVNSLVSATVLGQVGQAQLDAALQAADANLSSVPDGAVSVITLAQDSVVVPNNYDALVAAYPTKIRNAIKIDPANLMVLSPFSSVLGKPVFVPTDHMHGLIYEFVYALNIFNSFGFGKMAGSSASR